MPQPNSRSYFGKQSLKLRLFATQLRQDNLLSRAPPSLRIKAISKSTYASLARETRALTEMMHTKLSAKTLPSAANALATTLIAEDRRISRSVLTFIQERCTHIMPTEMACIAAKAAEQCGTRMARKWLLQAFPNSQSAESTLRRLKTLRGRQHELTKLLAEALIMRFEGNSMVIARAVAEKAMALETAPWIDPLTAAHWIAMAATLPHATRSARVHFGGCLKSVAQLLRTDNRQSWERALRLAATLYDGAKQDRPNSQSREAALLAARASQYLNNGQESRWLDIARGEPPPDIQFWNVGVSPQS